LAPTGMNVKTARTTNATRAIEVMARLRTDDDDEVFMIVFFVVTRKSGCESALFSFR
jgi:hypothetical protein